MPPNKGNKQVKKILMTTGTVGGVWSYALELSKSLGLYDIEVLLATMGSPMSDVQKAEAGRLDNIRTAQSSFKLEWMVNPLEDVKKAGDWLIELRDDYQPDLVHLNNFAHGSLDWKVPSIVVGHSCLYSWFEAVDGTLPPPEFDNYKSRVASCLRSADMVIAPSIVMLNELKKNFGPLVKSGVIYNGRNADDYLPGRKEPFVFSASRLWDRAKNSRRLARAAQSIKWDVLIAGEAVHPDGGRAEFSNVSFLGLLSQKDVASVMSRATIFAHPAKIEPFGLSVLEAALAGCALVLGDIPSLREIWEDEAAYVPPDNDRALGDTINYLIEHKDYRFVMAEKARRKAFNYSAKKMAEGYFKLYNDLALAR